MKKITIIFIIINLCFCLGFAKTTKVRVFPKPGTVALIFDDGPDPATTLKLLQVLKKYNVKATFDLIGYYAQNYPYLVKQIAKEGHSIANHSLSHLDLTKVSKQGLQDSIRGATKIIEGIIKRKIYCLEPPFLSTSYKVGVSMQRNHLRKVPAPLDSYDYVQIGTQAFINHTIKAARPGAIILLHDARPRTIAALPEIIKGIRRKGLGFSVICVPEK